MIRTSTILNNFLKLENDLGVSGEVALADFKTSVKNSLQIIRTKNRFEIENNSNSRRRTSYDY
jgi:hypothetical protein